MKQLEANPWSLRKTADSRDFILTRTILPGKGQQLQYLATRELQRPGFIDAASRDGMINKS
jgi:hypothetical protein